MSISLEDEAAVRARAAASAKAPSRVRRRTTAKDGSARPTMTTSSSAGQLHTFDALPEYLQDNEFIVTGYRYDLPVRDTLKSLFNLHNETGNVWSHLIGFMLFVALTVWVSRSPPTPLLLARPQVEELWHSVQGQLQALGGSVGGNLNSLQGSWPRLASLQHSLQESVHHLQDAFQGSWLQESVHSLQGKVQMGAHALVDELHHSMDVLLPPDSDATHPGDLLSGLARGLRWPSARWPVYVFCAGAMSCLLLSAICHLFGCCKKHIALIIWRLDYTGIALLIVSSFYPMVYYSFLCQPRLAAAYLGIITLLGSAAVSMSLLEVFQAPEWRPTRALLYVGLGLMGVVPLVHVLALHGDVWHVRRSALLDVLMGVSYVAGAAVYALRVPERWFPGKFDILLHSHQIFHLFVVLGALLHFKAVLLLLEWRDASGGCAIPLRHGPVDLVLHELAAKGHDLLHIDQVWAWLSAAVEQHHHLGSHASNGLHGLPGGVMMPEGLPAL